MQFTAPFGHRGQGARHYRTYIPDPAVLIEDGPAASRVPALDIEAAVFPQPKAWLNDRQAICASSPQRLPARELEATITKLALNTENGC